MKSSIQKIIQLARAGEIASQYADLVEVKTHPAGGLMILNYTENCQYKKAWDDVTIWCRGLILDTTTWQVAALPFPKFFNFGEHAGDGDEIQNLPKEAFSVYEKVDGSLGITYRRGDELALATRGSFTSAEAIAGTAFLRQLTNTHHVPNNLTLLFEVVCKDNRCVSRYDFEGLVLLSAIDLSTGQELEWPEVQSWARRLGCRTPQVYVFDTLADVIESRTRLPASREGYVVRFASGLRLKVKSTAYLAVYKLIAGISEEGLLEAYAEGTIEQTRAQLPEEFREEIERVIVALEQQAAALKTTAMDLLERSPQTGDRKEFSLWVKANAPAELFSVMFMLRDKRDVNWYKVLAASKFKKR